MAEGLSANAPYHGANAPLDRPLGYVDFRSAILTGDLPEFCCLLGTLVQESYDSPRPSPRRAIAACRHISQH